VDYAEIRTFPDLEKTDEINGTVIIAAAVKYSKVRLIDNILFSTE
jgi:pantoate--beta-alanine ligase